MKQNKAIFSLMLFVTLMFHSGCMNYTLIRSMRKVQSGNLEGALELLDKKLARNDQAWKLYSARAYCNALSGKNQDAIGDMNQAINIEDNNWMLYQQRAAVKFESGDLKGAAHDLNKSLSINSKENISLSAFYKVNIGTRYALMAQIMQRLDSCEKAAEYVKLAKQQKPYTPCFTEQNMQALEDYLTRKCGAGKPAKPGN